MCTLYLTHIDQTRHSKSKRHLIRPAIKTLIMPPIVLVVMTMGTYDPNRHDCNFFNADPNPNEGIPRTLGQGCATCSLGKVCVARPQIGAPGAVFEANALCAS